MTKKLVHLGDTSDHGGYMITANGNIRANGLRVCIEGDIHRCPIHNHGDTPVHTTTRRITTNRKGILREGDYAECGAFIYGSGNVRATSE